MKHKVKAVNYNELTATKEVHTSSFCNMEDVSLKVPDERNKCAMR